MTSMVSAAAHRRGEDASAVEEAGGVEKQANYHLPTVGITACEGALRAVFFLYGGGDVLEKGDIVNAKLTGLDRKHRAGVVEVPVHAVGVDNHRARAGGELVESTVCKAPHHAAILQRTVEEKQLVRAGIFRRDDGVFTLESLKFHDGHGTKV